ncbi:MAG: sigma-70 family RNA polymerase sigma factor [Nannocystaceae bacterium]|nr:sigma-70 family RNA polymerase sigma factor [Nannocystaceae bacterium]
MTPEQRHELELQIRQVAAEQHFDEAATRALRGYGPELLGFLVAAAQDDDLALEAFSMFSEDLWRGLAGFQWRATLRTWAYTVARRALYRARKSRGRRLAVEPLTSNAYNELAARVRTQTITILRSEVRSGVAALRQELSAEERMLLTLRVDREMSWREIAWISEEASEELSDEELARSVAALRKRFERTKNRLRALALERGVRT